LKPNNVRLSIARKELGDGLRNRWIWLVSVLLATAVLAIALLGTAPVGVAGARDSGVVIASLMNLAVYLVPLLALILGCGVLIDEKQRGTLDLILIYPVSTADYFVGTFLGFAAALSVALICGFGLSGVVLYVWSDVDLEAYLVLISLAIALGIVFLALSFLLSLLARDRGRAVATSVFVWMGSVLVFDLLLVGALVVSEGRLSTTAFNTIVLFNPADVFRILCFVWLDSTVLPMGLSAVTADAPSSVVLSGALILWAVVPLLICYGLFKKRIANDTLL
jgi:Cu-processing system permease protein